MSLIQNTDDIANLIAHLNAHQDRRHESQLKRPTKANLETIENAYHHDLR